MKTKILTIAGTFLLLTNNAWGMEIRQELYGYPLSLTRPVQLPIYQHFIISNDASFRARPESRPFPEVYFGFDSAWVSPDETYKLLTSLQECGFSGPLQIAGYTCALGMEMQNQTLSQRRADAVAFLLRKSGYKIFSAEGKGKLYGRNQERNRKVQIIPAIQPITHNHVQKSPKERSL